VTIFKTLRLVPWKKNHEMNFFFKFLVELEFQKLKFFTLELKSLRLKFQKVVT